MGQKELPAELALVGGGPGGRHHSREPLLGEGLEAVSGEGDPADKDPQLALANCLSNSFEVIPPPTAVILLPPFSHRLSPVS